VDELNAELSVMDTEVGRLRDASSDAVNALSAKPNDGELNKVHLRLVDEFTTTLNKRSEIVKRLAELQKDEEVDPKKQADAKAAATQAKSVSDKSAFPHMMWWVAAEGQPVQAKRRAGWTLHSDINYDAATILVGTEEELHRIEAEMAFESK